MRSVILYYVVQAQAAELHRQAQREAGALPGYGAVVAAALAGAWADPPWWLYHRLNRPPRARAHPVVSGGLPGWQITLLLAAAALLAAAIAVTVSRRRARRRRIAARTA